MKGNVLVGSLFLATALAGQAHAAVSASPAPSSSAQAVQVLRAVATAIQGASSVSFTAAAIDEDVSPTNEKIEHPLTIEAQVQRPNMFHAVKHGAEEKQFWYDGHTMTLLNSDSKKFFTADAPASIDDLLDLLAQKDIDAPLADLFYSNLYDVLSKNITSASYVGLETVAGKQFHHMAFRQADVDWQLWVTTDRVPQIQRITITSKLATGSPEYRVQITNWQNNARFDVSQFAASVPSDATRVDNPIAVEEQ